MNPERNRALRRTRPSERRMESRRREYEASHYQGRETGDFRYADREAEDYEDSLYSERESGDYRGNLSKSRRRTDRDSGENYGAVVRGASDSYGESRGGYQRDYRGEYQSGNLSGTSAKRGKAQKRGRRRKRGGVFKKLLAFLLVLALGFTAWSYVSSYLGEKYWTVAVFGLDSRDGNLGKGALSDVIMVASINRRDGSVKLSSIYRDTYTQVDEEGKYHKLNEAYFLGGHEQALAALERNFDLKIDDYVSFNWAAVAKAITALGGVDLEISDSEFKFINAFITETVNSTRLGSVQLEHAGMNHLDGVQAVAYGRLRLMDTDFNRTARQRKVLSLAMEKAKEANAKTLADVARYVFPEVSTSMGINDVITLARNVKKYEITDSQGFPFARTTKKLKKMDCVVPGTLESNVVQLQNYLYGTENYEPSETVKKISAHIQELSGVGVLDNAEEVRLSVGAGSSGAKSANAEAGSKGAAKGNNQGAEQGNSEKAIESSEALINSLNPEDSEDMSEAHTEKEEAVESEEFSSESREGENVGPGNIERESLDAGNMEPGSLETKSGSKNETIKGVESLEPGLGLEKAGSSENAGNEDTDSRVPNQPNSEAGNSGAALSGGAEKPDSAASSEKGENSAVQEASGEGDIAHGPGVENS